MMYSVNNAAKSNNDFNNGKVPETAQKKAETPEDRAKTNIAFDFKTAFNQANLLTEQAAQIGNAQKTNFLADLLESKDPDNIFSALNLTFESGQNSSSASRNFNSQGRFQNWSSQPNNFSNSFASPQA